MERKYKTLYQLSTRHDYYDNNLSDDFKFVPSERTEVDLKNYRLTSKRFNAAPESMGSNGLITLYSEIEGSPLISIAPGSIPKGVYGMYLVNDSFNYFTDEVSELEGGEIFYFTNVGASEVSGVITLLRTKHILKRTSFPYSFTVGVAPVTATVKILDASGAELTDYEQTLTSDTGDFDALINLDGIEDGRYQVKVESGGGTVQTDDYYISNEYALNRPFAILEIVVADNTSLSNKELRIQFTPREEVWKYFIVFKTPPDGGDVIVVDQASGLNFSEVTSFVGPSREEDLATKESLEARFPDAEVRLFESDTTVLYQEFPETNIKLTKNSEPLINNLPSPSVQSPKAEAYIMI